MGKSLEDLERGNEEPLEQIHIGSVNHLQPRKFERFHEHTAQPDYMSWSTASLFMCFIWGIFAFMESNKVRKYNKMKAYDEAARHSRLALQHNRSAVACLVVMLLIIGVPLAISLAVQGSIFKFPHVRHFFG